jgi:hypothetical protein
MMKFLGRLFNLLVVAAFVGAAVVGYRWYYGDGRAKVHGLTATGLRDPIAGLKSNSDPILLKATGATSCCPRTTAKLTWVGRFRHSKASSRRRLHFADRLQGY